MAAGFRRHDTTLKRTGENFEVELVRPVGEKFNSELPPRNGNPVSATFAREPALTFPDVWHDTFPQLSGISVIVS